MLGLNDHDLDALCLTLAARQRALPFFGQQRRAQWQAAGDLVAEFPAVSRYRKLFGDLLEQRSAREDRLSEMSIALSSHAAA